VREEPRRQASQDKLPQEFSPDATAEGSVHGPARPPPPDDGGKL